MDHFAGLDVSVKDTSVCIVDDTGRMVREVKVASEPEALLAVLTVRRTLREQIGILHGRLLAIVRDDDVCRRLMTVPGGRPCGDADLSRHRRRTRTVPKLQGGRGSVWTDTLQVPIR